MRQSVERKAHSNSICTVWKKTSNNLLIIIFSKNLMTTSIFRDFFSFGKIKSIPF